MTTPGLPNFPTNASLERKIKAYQRKAAEHRGGRHKSQVKGCKPCADLNRKKAN
jgi:hypothetical protein